MSGLFKVFPFAPPLLPKEYSLQLIFLLSGLAESLQADSFKHRRPCLIHDDGGL